MRPVESYRGFRRNTMRETGSGIGKWRVLPRSRNRKGVIVNETLLLTLQPPKGTGGAKAASRAGGSGASA
jgi:hypothetical protein